MTNRRASSDADTIAELRKALEPFAAAADRCHEATKGTRLGDPYTATSRITVGDLRRARTTLEQSR